MYALRWLCQLTRRESPTHERVEATVPEILKPFKISDCTKRLGINHEVSNVLAEASRGCEDASSAARNPASLTSFPQTPQRKQPSRPLSGTSSDQTDMAEAVSPREDDLRTLAQPSATACHSKVPDSLPLLIPSGASVGTECGQLDPSLVFAQQMGPGGPGGLSRGLPG